MTLAVADCVHIIIYFSDLLKRGYRKYDAILESMKVNGIPIFITSITTAIGFLALNFSEAPPYRHLGNLTALGIILALMFSVVTLPALLYVLPIKKRKNRNSENEDILAVPMWADGLTNFIFEHSKKIILGFTLILIPLFYWGILKPA